MSIQANQSTIVPMLVNAPKSTNSNSPNSAPNDVPNNLEFQIVLEALQENLIGITDAAKEKDITADHNAAISAMDPSLVNGSSNSAKVEKTIDSLRALINAYTQGQAARMSKKKEQKLEQEILKGLYRLLDVLVGDKLDAKQTKDVKTLKASLKKETHELLSEIKAGVAQGVQAGKESHSAATATDSVGLFSQLGNGVGALTVVALLKLIESGIKQFTLSNEASYADMNTAMVFGNAQATAAANICKADGAEATAAMFGSVISVVGMGGATAYHVYSDVTTNTKINDVNDKISAVSKVQERLDNPLEAAGVAVQGANQPNGPITEAEQMNMRRSDKLDQIKLDGTQQGVRNGSVLDSLSDADPADLQRTKAINNASRNEKALNRERDGYERTQKSQGNYAMNIGQIAQQCGQMYAMNQKAIQEADKASYNRTQALNQAVVTIQNSRASSDAQQGQQGVSMMSAGLQELAKISDISGSVRV